MQKITHKRGDTFQRSVVLSENGSPIDLTGWAIESQLRLNDALVAALTVQVQNPTAGNYWLVCDDTSAWPIGTMLCDIQYTTPAGAKTSTETFAVQVIPDVTR